MAASIKVEHLSKFYGHKAAIRNLSFTIEPGQIVGFLGPNGAGKSTTLRILCGLLPASEGCVYVNGMPLTTQLQRIKCSLGYMPENNPLPEDMRVEEYLRFRAHLKRIDNVTMAIGDAMERCDLLRTAAKKMICTLSKGFRQRVGIADALLGRPQFIILDEPTIGLDPHQIIGIRDLLKNLKDETTVIFSSHILPEVEAACHKLLIIHQGELVADGTSESLRETYFPQKRYKLFLQTPCPELTQEFLQNNSCFKCLHNESHHTFTLELKENVMFQENDFVRCLCEKNYPLRQFFKIEPTLEMLFLKLTKFSWKESVFFK